jgi:hypothetical protein
LTPFFEQYGVPPNPFHLAGQVELVAVELEVYMMKWRQIISLLLFTSVALFLIKVL